MHQIAFGGQASPRPTGELEHSPNPLAMRQASLQPVGTEEGATLRLGNRIWEGEGKLDVLLSKDIFI